MPSQLNPYMQFDGNARQAMEFYREVFDGELTVGTFGEYGNEDPTLAGKTMHAVLRTTVDSR
jgi:PhnB protein